ncbi:MAG: YetF domain-containing protein [Sporolactobacillus sp.]
MGTVIVRTIVLFVFLGLGLKKALADRGNKDSFSERLIAAACTVLACVAVAEPDEPFERFLLPITMLMVALLIQRRVRALRQGNGHSAEYANQKAALLPEAAMPLIESGRVCSDNLHKIGRSTFWLRKEMQKFGYRDIRTVNYLTIDRFGNYYLDDKQSRF